MKGKVNVIQYYMINDNGEKKMSYSLLEKKKFWEL